MLINDQCYTLKRKSATINSDAKTYFSIANCLKVHHTHQKLTFSTNLTNSTKGKREKNIQSMH